MSTIHLNETTTATPEQLVAGLTDFGPGRSELFPRSADQYLEVHDRSPGRADVTEGSGGIWERLHYDWSDPNRVVMTTTDSNLWGRDSGHTYTFMRKPDGTTDLDVVVVREGKNIRGGRSRSCSRIVEWGIPDHGALQRLTAIRCPTLIAHAFLFQDPSRSPPTSPHPSSDRRSTMDITIIGTGNMARGIATRALEANHPSAVKVLS